MGKLIVSTEMTADGVIDSIDEWFRPEGDHEDLSRERLLAADALLLGRQTYQGLAGVAWVLGSRPGMLVAPVSPLAGTLACALGRPGNASPNHAQRGSAR